MTEREVVLCRDAGESNCKAAAQFIELARHSIALEQRFTVALSGGSTPKALYSLLASPEYREKIDWPWVHLFWGDERCVPPEHAESNFRMTREALLSKINLPERNIHRMAGEKDPAVAAIDYENQLRTFFASTKSACPALRFGSTRFGEDGHTASLFPGSTAWLKPNVSSPPPTWRNCTPIA